MSGSGNNKITSVLGASIIATTGSAVISSKHPSLSWMTLTLSITASLALLALLLKLASAIVKKRG